MPGLEINTEPRLPKINSLLTVFSLQLTLLVRCLATAPCELGMVPPLPPTGVLSGLRSLQSPNSSGEWPLLPKQYQTFFQTLLVCSSPFACLGSPFNAGTLPCGRPWLGS